MIFLTLRILFQDFPVKMLMNFNYQKNEELLWNLVQEEGEGSNYQNPDWLHKKTHSNKKHLLENLLFYVESGAAAAERSSLAKIRKKDSKNSVRKTAFLKNNFYANIQFFVGFL